ncbi:hypothetical protein MMC07_006940 [Pseudocyphellaria aurata]|nr:hypothetical protein [Pseudocyphellaria aurata]
MSETGTKPKYEWLVILPDYEGVLDKRLEVRRNHIQGLEALVKKGFWTFGGATLDQVPEEGKKLQINGSIMLALAESKEAVLEVLKEDVYCKSGVWDWEKVQIHPVSWIPTLTKISSELAY